MFLFELHIRCTTTLVIPGSVLRGQVQPPGQAEAQAGEAAGRGGGLLGAREEEPRRHREAQAAGQYMRHLELVE